VETSTFSNSVPFPHRKSRVIKEQDDNTKSTTQYIIPTVREHYDAYKHHVFMIQTLTNSWAIKE
jgi:hypothetical protein